MSDTLPAIAFIGAGSMGGAIVRGLAASGVPVDGPIRVTNRTAARAATLAGIDGVESIALEERPEGNAEAIAASRVVVLGVKPQRMPELLHDIAPHVRDDAIVVTLAAGVPLATYEAGLPGAAVVRAMPNTPSTVGKGVTGIAAGTHATPEDLAIVRRLFETVGEVLEVRGDDGIDAISTISGSGPAYVFLLIEKLAEAARHQGFGDDEALLLARGTFAGATALLDAEGEEPAELRRRVTSPQGTTERAIAVLQDAHLDQVFADATDAAYARAKELAGVNPTPATEVIILKSSD
ncbi:pyrroline-5-carboxylate reductase [Microbacterium sediminis]|uniref:Pyrroline-5-carboxylate reductase n=1 Tax=Microbacterium sediminis TaxID=904291 RepID=A0A1B9NDD3_9MICO|nr:pyrroline-5-carboxylate reductase [Microbacterium sediminis]OCG74619.1 pyrroline-5-carboxylate reductase [Microbacterium sediminis]QBR74914.1 pyrroline-5-carboxylate reductase [Microbacterium sediminis]